jgi:hypothetical protein
VKAQPFAQTNRICSFVEGVRMKAKWYLGILALGSVALLTSCSGLGTQPCDNCGGGGNANLTISLYDTPPTGTSILSFTLPIAGISLTPSSGSPVSVTTAVSSTELTRLQTESTVIVDQASVAADSYTSINVTIGPTSSTNNLFVNTSGSAITYSGGTCANNTVCTLPVGAIFTVSIPISLTLANNQNQWIGLDFNLNRAITSSNGISVDFSQTGVLTATTTTRAGIPSGSVDTMQDFTGVVTAYTPNSSITVRSGISGVSLTASLSSATEYDLAPVIYSNCSGTAAACVAVGSTVSIDTNVSASGTFAATEVDVLDSTSVDEVEGIILPTSTAGVVQLVLADKVSTSGNAVLSAPTTTAGTILFLTATTPNFSVDTKTLSSQIIQPVIGFAGSGDLLGGQVVRAQVTNVVSGSGGITALANNVLLRYSRLSGTVNKVTTNVFTIANLPGYIYSLNPTMSTSAAQVLTYPNLTAFDGVTSLTDLRFQNATSVSIRALYLNSPPATYPFQAAKVRVP